ncbi:MAG: HAMP domain-containing histidine kinase [Psychromonas sp.]|nr:HAMP domain-containing histidine kinase [Psychromonas sp.]
MIIMKHKLTSIILILLIIASIATLLFYQFGFYHTYTVNFSENRRLLARSDQGMGGTSTVSLAQTQQGLRLSCDIKKSDYEWPFCQVAINIAEIDKNSTFDFSKKIDFEAHWEIFSKGVDLSDHDEIFFKMKYEGNEPQRVRVYLRNYNKVYTDLVKDSNSLKINEVEFSPNQYPDGQYIPLNTLQVASWWSSARAIPLKYSGNEFNNISMIEISTPGITSLGAVEILIQEISFRKLLIPKEQLLLFMLLSWIVSGIFYLIFRLHHSQSTLQRLAKAMKALKETQQKLVESEKLASLGNLVAGLAHEINTPLGVSITYASHVEYKLKKLTELINSNQIKKSELDEMLADLDSASEGTGVNLQRTSELVQAFKTLAINSDSSKASKFIMSQLINDTVITLDERLKQSKVDVTVSCPDDLELISYPREISQIIIGFIENSISHAFADRKLGKISIVASINDDVITVAYSDDGCGITPEDCKNIFEPFFTTRRNTGHIGLGLNTIHNIVVKLLEGEISISSEGVGIQIMMTFPVMTQN